jgi:hypothetical protein
MAPRHASGPADRGPAAHAPATTGQPTGFTHEEYDYRAPGSDDLIIGLADPILGSIQGTIDDVVGEWRNGIQRVQLAQGLSMRPAGPIPRTNAAAYEHPELKQMIDTSEPS